ncbi:MAG: S-layer homology domain-containing protein, partial [Oscillospiraceae bacterium]|nr:S-layer homology domain-containing protein [Oscillospiraceae bacterium]
KKLISLVLSTAILMTFAVIAEASSLPADDDIEAILDVMEIMTYDTKGNFNESQYVTRAALAKIRDSASQQKGAATASSRISPFSDVMYTHWGAPYISVASKNKFMTGYSDGSFRPDSYIKYEEALSAMLRLLGYTNADYTGAYPAGHISKAADIGLSDEVYISAGNPIVRSEMAKLVYNLLNTRPKGGEGIYAQSLGYTPSSEFLTIGDVLGDNVIGPKTVKADTISTLGLTSARVYRNGNSANISDIENYDVIYYSKKRNAIWAYSNKVSGILENITPNKEAPTSVTVSGVTYALPYYAAKRAFGLDGLEAGETVTMLLDKNGKVCDAYEAGKLYETITGVVTAIQSKTLTTQDGTKVSGYYATILTLDGSSVDIEQSGNSTSLIGQAVEVDYYTGKIRTISKGSGSYSGYINASSLTWGSTLLDRNIKIIEIDGNGNMVKPTLSRLDGVTLKSENILLSTINSSGAIDGLILKDVTGDMHKYGLITKIDRNTVSDGSGGQSPSKYVYHYDLGGQTGTVTFSGALSSLTEGPCVFIYDDGVLTESKNLIRATNVTLITPSYATVGGSVKHRISQNVQVYKIADDSKIKTTLDEAVSHDGEVWIYYDKSQSEGGMVRVIYLK